MWYRITKYLHFYCYVILIYVIVYQTKPEANDLNVYNHNFKGLYCVCQRPYPDSENTDEMIQCIVCEDWFHSKVLLIVF